MSSTTASTTLDIFESILTGVGQYLAGFAPILLLFAFLFGMFTTVILILGLWRTR